MALVRYNFNTFDNGEEYFNRLQAESDRNFTILMSLLSSYWQSTIDGPNYARELKAIAIELSRLRLALEDIQQDTYYATTRTEFLYQVVTSMLFPQPGGAPDLEKSDEDFRQFLLQIVNIYYAGSIPDSLTGVVELITSEKAIIHEGFLEARKPGSGYDISDQFSYSIDVLLDSPGQINTILSDKNIRLMFSIIRPAHTLYELRYVLKDTYNGSAPSSKNPSTDLSTHKAVDISTVSSGDYRYEDFRRFVDGVCGVDPFGFKRPISITAEDHSSDW